MEGPPKTRRTKRWGPGFLRPDSFLYRLEMAIATITFAALLVWRGVAFGDLNVLLTVFWFLFPDLVAFIPIGLAGGRGGRWPTWGPFLYNSVHTFLAWIPVFVVWSTAAGRIEWPLLAWAGHITLDRAVGYYLRSPE